MSIPERFHFTHRRQVEFSDTDLAGIMHFANFFRFLESAEHAFFRSLGFRVHVSEGDRQHGWPRLEVSCKYFKPARFEEMLEICICLEEIRTSSLRYGFWIFAADHPDRTPLAAGSCAIVYVALDGSARSMRKAPIPADLRRKFERLLAPATSPN